MITSSALSASLLFLLIRLTAAIDPSKPHPFPLINSPNDGNISDIPDRPVDLTGDPTSAGLAPRDCSEILDDYDKGLRPEAPPSGTYRIFPVGCAGCYFNVYCDMQTEGGGWTIIERRTGGDIDFYRGWDFYKMGFGRITGDHFLGFERIRMLTEQKMMELQIWMRDIGELETIAGYGHFSVGNSSQGYALRVESYYGDAGDYLTASNNGRFSTFDRDNDGVVSQNCAKYFHGAWWFGSTPGAVNCGSQSNLHGFYYLGRKELPNFAGPGMSWRPVPGPGGPAVKEVVWKVRPMGYTGSLHDPRGFAASVPPPPATFNNNGIAPGPVPAVPTRLH